MSTIYKGINYAGPASTANRDTATGIRNGVIHQNEVLQAWADSSEPYYGKPSESVECPECHRDLGLAKEWGDTLECEECGERVEIELPDCAEPLSFSYEADGYAAECGDSGDIFVCRSPYFTYAQFCSPCAPGACYLMNWLETADEDNKAYCFGHDWFDGGKAPYPVYSVETGEPVNP